MRVFLIVGCAAFCLLGIYGWLKRGFEWEAAGAILFFGSGLLFFLFQERINAFIERKRKQNILDRNCVINDDHFFFPKGYYFKHGAMKGRKELLFREVDELWLNTYPPSALVNGNEVIFLRGLTNEQCAEVAARSKIALAKPIDIWSLILEEFLDTEFSDKMKQRALDILSKHGLSEEEVERIRKRVSWRMLAVTYASWEWVHYGQFDLLRQYVWVTEKWYWRTMEVALKGRAS